jgi:ABC transporter substrate binding protein
MRAYGFRLAAGYVDRILRGDKPADLPVEASVKYQLVVNLKAAKAIGLTIPETFLVRPTRSSNRQQLCETKVQSNALLAVRPKGCSGSKATQTVSNCCVQTLTAAGHSQSFAAVTVLRPWLDIGWPRAAVTAIGWLRR